MRTFEYVNIDKIHSEMYNSGMLYKFNELLTKYGSRRKVASLIKKGTYLKVAHGLYSDKKTNLIEKEKIFAKYRFATLTMQSAFEYYDLSDYIPEYYYVVTPINSVRIKEEKVKQLYMSKKMIDIGRNRIDTEYGYIYIFDIERMLIELFRLKSQLDEPYFLELVKSYRRLAEENRLDYKKINEYCSKITNGTNIKKKILEIILWLNVSTS